VHIEAGKLLEPIGRAEEVSLQFRAKDIVDGKRKTKEGMKHRRCHTDL